jgi:hypothetical protein
MEKQNYLEMVQATLDFYKKYPILSSDKDHNSIFSSFVNGIRRRYKRTDIIVFYLSYWRLTTLNSVFLEIQNNIPSVPTILREQIFDYVSGFRQTLPDIDEVDAANKVLDVGLLEILRSAYADAVKLVNVYYASLVRTRSETIQSLSGYSIVSVILSKILNNVNPWVVPNLEKHYSYASSMSVISSRLDHFFSLSQHFPIFDGFSFYNKTANVIFAELQKRERAYKENIRGIPESELTDDVSLLIQFPDGFAWFDLNTSVSKDEATMMGHCCTDPRTKYGGTVYSLRKLTKKSGITYHNSHVTVMVKDRATYEIKGRGNDKPASQYHKYLIALIKSPLIEKMIGGGYMAENNFTLGDLTNHEREKLLELKPDLVPVTERYMQGALSDEDLKKFKQELSEDLSNTIVFEVTNDFITISNDDYIDFGGFKEALKEEYPDAGAIVDLMLSVGIRNDRYTEIIDMEAVEKYNIPNYHKIITKCVRYLIENHPPLHETLSKKFDYIVGQLRFPFIANDTAPELAVGISEIIKNHGRSEFIDDKLLTEIVDPLLRLVARGFYDTLFSNLRYSIGSTYIVMDDRLEYEPRLEIATHDADLSSMYDEESSLYDSLLSEIRHNHLVDYDIGDDTFDRFDEILEFFGDSLIADSKIDYRGINKTQVMSTLSDKLLELLELE